MYSPHKFADRIGNIGTPLPNPYPVFDLAGVKFCRGAVSMIAGTPSSYKTVLALNMLVRWARMGLMTLYFCADSDEFTVTERLSGIITGDNFNLVEERMTGPKQDYYKQHYAEIIEKEFYDDAKRASKVQFEYEPMQGSAEIATHLKSWEAAYGGYPDIVILDNLTDYVSNSLAFDEMHALLGDSDGIAKETQSHVSVLHHARLQDKTKDDEKPPGWPPPAWQVAGRLTQKPRLALTIAASGLAVKVAVVKNSLGPRDPEAENPYDFMVYRSMQMQDRVRH